ncbi:hypothetical protein GOA58_32185 [Sinorhizobium meliloti]|nr:hypothetical protein [Sinorhizobium meliloti]MDW9665031.1 hypothetical protein [Sinorhizobium meliloti]MDX0054829.1 hypothetical protein [Sinorhizobium meliloti]MDX0309484.1 hypothetical protein [Sinorhizobium meliloti]RVI52403.1 hypothetical protein CN189_33240 [Sinorhizobium meliloti]
MRCPNDRDASNNEGNKVAAQRQIAFYGKGDSATAVAVRPSKQLKKDLDAYLWLAACLAGKSAASGDRWIE